MLRAERWRNKFWNIKEQSGGGYTKKTTTTTAEDTATHLTSNYPIEYKLSNLFLLIRAYQLPVTPTRQHAIDTVIDIAHSNFSPAHMITRLITKFKHQNADCNNAERQASNT